MTTKGTTLKTKFLKSAGAAGAMAVALTALGTPAMADEHPNRGARAERDGRDRNAPAPRAEQRPSQPTGGALGYRGAVQQGQPRPQMQQQAQPQGMPQGQPRMQGEPRPAHAWSGSRPEGQPQNRPGNPGWNGSRGNDNQRPPQGGSWAGRPQQDNRGPNVRGPGDRGPDRRPDWAQQNGNRPGGSYQGRPPQGGPGGIMPDRNRPSWQGNNPSWKGNQDRRWANDDRRWNNNDRRWNNDWRHDRRYDWRDYRDSHRDVYRGRSYYSPYRGYAYRRVSIGFTLGSLFYGSSYWLDDPWMYRLPPVYGPYRWVRYYDDVLLVNVYTGEVVDVIYDFFW